MTLTQITEKGIKDGEIIDADINTSAAIAGSKINPLFTSNIEIQNNAAGITFTDTDDSKQFYIQTQGDELNIVDATNSTTKLGISNTGHITLRGNVTVNDGYLEVANANLYIEESITHSGDGDTRIRFSGNDEISLETAGSSRLFIDSNGDVLIGTTAWTTSSGGLMIDITSDPIAQIQFSRPSSFTGSQNVMLNYHNGTYIGGINTTTTATSFPTSSDYRLKENVVAMSDGIKRLKTLKPYKFNFKHEPSKTVDGFFAHEVSSVVPDAVFGEKDGEQMQGLDHSKLVPLLTAALQEAVIKIEVLATKVAALEAA